MEQTRSMNRSWHLWLICLFLFAIAACSTSDSAPSGEAASLSSETVGLSWDPSVGPEVAGYKIYQATASGAYGAPIATVPIDLTSYTVTGLEVGFTYFFAVTAYNSDGSESSYSNEVSKAIF